MNIKKYSFPVVAVLSVVILLITGCTSDDNKDDIGNAESGDSGYFAPDPIYEIPTLEERTSWNIELEYLEIDEKGVWVRICDHDNLGFYYNPAYFVLEYYEDGEWVKISALSEKSESQDYAIVYPEENNDFTDTNCLSRFLFMTVDELKPGNYKLTKVLSGREFYIEFEVND